MALGRGDHEHGELADWRAATLRRLSRLLVVLTTPALIVVALSRGPIETPDRLLVLAIPLAFLVIAALSRDPRRTRVLAMALVLSVSAICLVMIVRYGAVPAALLGLACALVLTAIFFGKRAAWSSALATTLFLVLVGGANAAGLLHPVDPSALFEWSKLGTWVRVAAAYFAAMAIVASVVATLIARLEEDIREREKLLAAEREARAVAETAHAEAREAAERAEDANRLKDEFLSTVSHELRTPLHAITGWAQMLASGALPAERRDHALDVIVRSARSQEKLIADLLDVGRITSGRLSLSLAPVSPADVIRMAVESVKPAADARRVQIVCTHDGRVPAIRADAGRLQQVVTNLLSNAIKFSPTGSRVEVTVAHESSNVAITVRDHGAGIEPSFLPHVFTPFRQADGGFARSQGGLGLGLTIAKRLVELHGGSIEAKSEGAGHGATFVARVPSGSSPDDGTPRASSSPPEASSPGGRELDDVSVLFIEDDADSRELLVQLFEASGARVCEAASGEEAIGHLLREKPDVIVSDIGLRGEDGLALLKELRGRHGAEGIPAVALTAFVRAEDRERALAAGFDAHVAKPVEAGRLVRTVAELLHARR
jgi:signal transduction histidine kinase